LFNKESACQVWGDSTQVFNERLTNHLIELINPKIKPLECIGTSEENYCLVNQLLDKKLVLMNPKQANTYKRYSANLREQFSDSDLYKLNGQNLAPPKLNKKIERIIIQLLSDVKGE
jgi:hypothetical protein